MGVAIWPGLVRGLLVALAASPAQAYLVQQNVAMTLRAGAYCNHAPDGSFDAPQTRDGAVSIFDQPYDFILEGDTLPALPDLGIGVVVDLKSFTQDETLTVESLRFEDMTPPDRWDLTPTAEGRFWIGTFPDPGKGLPEGRYQFSVLRGTQRLFVYDFTVVAPDALSRLRTDLDARAVEDLALLCVATTS